MKHLSYRVGSCAWAEQARSRGWRGRLLALLALGLAQPAGAHSGATGREPVRPLAPAATAPVITSLSPARNAAAATNKSVAITFDQAVSNAGNIRLFSSQYLGRRVTTVATSGNTTTITPTGGNFQAGETVSVTVPASVTGTSGGLATPSQVYQFTTAVTGGYGTFGAANNLALGSTGSTTNAGQDVAVGDVTNDGLPDLLVAYYSSNGSGVRVHAGQSNGSFATIPSAIYTQTDNPTQLLLADVNNDGRLDLLTTNYGGNTLSLRLNTSSGLANTTTALLTGGHPLAIASGDLDADGNLDLAVINVGDNSATVLRGSGTGTFTTTTLSSGFATPAAVALADVTNDGKLDLVYTLNSTTKTLNVLPGNGDGTFGTALTAFTLAGYSAPRNLALADVDGDGDLDVAVANDYANNVSLLENNGSGVFALASGGTITTARVNDVAFGDVDGDGLPDLLISQQTNGLGVSLNRNTTSTRFATPLAYAANAGSALAVADIDLDGDLDVVTCYQSATSVSVLTNQALAPTLASFSPTSAAAGTVVTLTGTSLKGATGVRFGTGGLATAITVNSAGTILTAVVPINAASGALSVTTPIGTATLSGFTYAPRPNLVARLSPTGPLSTCQPLTLTAAAFSPSFSLTGTGFNNIVKALAVQTDGKVLVGGAFTAYNGTAANRIARLNADGSLDASFNAGGAGADNLISTLAVQADGKVLLSGNFTTYNGSAAKYLARLNADGSFDATFNPGGAGANSTINTLAGQADGKVLVGGSFTAYNGTAAKYLMRLNADGSLDATFNAGGAGANGTVSTLAGQADGKVLVGGYFTTYNGTAATRVARLNADGSLDTSFNAGRAGANNTVSTLAVQANDQVLMGGFFTAYNGMTVNRLVRFNADGTLDTAFNSGGTGFNSVTYSVVVQADGQVLVGGDFTTYNGSAAKYFARLTTSGSLDASFNAGGTGFNGSSAVYALAVQADGQVLAGGSFATYNGTDAPCLVRLTANGSLNTTDVPLSGATFSFSPGNRTGSTLTTSTAGTYTATATLSGVTSDASNAVVLTSMCPVPTLASLSPMSGAAGTVVTLTGTNLTGATGVRFGTGGLATAITVNAAGTSLTAVVPVSAASGAVGVTTPGGTATLSGFTYAPRPNLVARLSPTGPLSTCQPPTLTAAAFSPPFNAGGTGMNSFVNSVTVQTDGKVLVGGYFSSYNGVTVNRIARLNADASFDASFNPGGAGANALVNALAVQADGKVLVGGSFTTYNGSAAKYLARLNADGSLDASFNPGGVGANSAINVLAVQADGKVLASGGFTTYNGSAVNYITRLNTDGSLDASFNSGGAGANNAIGTLVVQADGKVLVGGYFTTYNGTAATRIARLNADGSLDASFNAGGAGANGPVSRLAGQADGKVLLSGGFTTYNGSAAKYLARLNADGSFDATFNAGGAGANSTISALAGQVDGKVLVGGGFTTYNGSTAKYLTRLNADGSLDATFNAGGVGANGTVSTLAVQADGQVLAGGSFATYNGTSAHYLARLTADGSLNTTDVPLSGATFSFSPGGGMGSTLTTSTAGTYTATATLNGFTSDASNAVVLTACPAPMLTSLSPTSGVVGASITLTGTNLTGATSVSFNGTITTAIIANTGTDLTVAVPTDATTGDVTVTTPGGTSNGLAFTVTVPTPVDLVVSDFEKLPGGTYRNVTITGPATGGAGTLLLGAHLTVTGTLTVQDGATLNAGEYSVLGSGNFVLADGGQLTLANPNGISNSDASGAVQVTGSRTFSTDATYRYGAATALIGTTGTGLPAQVRKLQIATDAAGTSITLSQPVAISQVLWVGSGSVLNTNGYSLTLLSSAQGTALANLADNGQVNGQATVQRYLDPTLNPGLGYRQYSSPVQAQSFAGLSTSGFAPELSQAGAYNSSATPGTTTPFPTVFDFDESRIPGTVSNYADFDKGWHAPTQATLAVGRGYTVHLPASEKISFLGALNTANQRLPLSYTAGSQAGWQLVGNPYAAPLDWRTVSLPANLEAAMYVFESTGPYAGQYRSYANGVGSSPLIASGQGFFVRTTGPETLALSYQNCVLDYATANDPVFQRAADSRPSLRLALQGAGTLADDLYVYVEAGATPGLDARYDALKLPNTTGLNLAATALTGQPLAIQGLPALGSQATVVPLTVQVPQAGSYTLAVGELANFAVGTDLVLHDQLLHTTTALTAATRYAFQAASTTANGRFYLELRPQNALATAGAQAQNQQVQVYPNPARGRFQVQLPAGLGAAKLTLYNALGQAVRTQAVAGDQATLEVAALAAGVYVLRVQAGAATITKRIVLE